MQVLVTDDSKIIRKKVISHLSKIGEYTFFEADSGMAAIDILNANKNIKAVILDINMPGIDGITTMQVIRDKYNCPCIIYSSFTKKNRNLTFEAIELGAYDVIHKPHGIGNYSFDDSINDIHKCLLNIKTKSSAQLTSNLQGIILIGMSTGGPKTIREILPNVKSLPYHAIVIVQHMPESFIPSFADSMNAYALMPSSVAKHNEQLEPGRIYLAPGGQNLSLSVVKGSVRFSLSALREDQYFSPQIDQTFESAANVFGRNVLAIVLTGMGNDGAFGAKKIKENGGFVVTESEDSCIVNGMPKSTKELIEVDVDTHKSKIAKVINSYNQNRELVA